MFEVRKPGNYIQVVIKHENIQIDLGLLTEIELADLYEEIKRDLEDIYEIISEASDERV